MTQPIETPFQVRQATAPDFLKTIDDESVDLVIIDPPWDSLDKWRAVGTTTRCKDNWFPTLPVEQIVAVIDTLYDKLKKNAHCYVFGAQQDVFRLSSYILMTRDFGERRKDDWTLWKSLVWLKSGRLGMGYHYRSKHEMVCFLEKGKRKLRNLGMPDVLDVKVVTKKSLGGRDPRACEKPVDLMKMLVENSSEPGELVLDCFMGSGSVGEAAVSMGRRFVGCDVQAEAVRLVCARLGGEGKG